MFNNCCVVNCKSRRKDVILHNFPRTEFRLQNWLQCLCAHDNLRRLGEAELLELHKLYVCHKHFEKRFITTKHRLYADAYPTLFNSNEITTGIPERVYFDTVSETVSPHIEHNYFRKRKHDEHTYSKTSDVMPFASCAVQQIPLSNLCPQSEVVSCASSAMVETSTSSLYPQSEVMPSTSCPIEQIPINLHCSDVMPSTSCAVQQIPVSNLCPQSEVVPCASPAMNESEVVPCASPAMDESEVVPCASPAMDETSTSSLYPQSEVMPSTPCPNKQIPVNLQCTEVMPSTPCPNKQIPVNLQCSGAVTLNVSPKRRRLFQKIKCSTPNCQRIYQEYRKSRKQLDSSRRARRALKFNKNEAFDRLTKTMNPLAKKILWMQVKQCSKKSKGRRFTLEEKLIGLSIMKESPKYYSFLKKIFVLPSKTTINKLISDINIESGINPQHTTGNFQAVTEEVPNALVDRVGLSPSSGDILTGC